MSNTNTIFGWVLFSGIVALGLTSVSRTYFQADNPQVHDDHYGYVIEASEDGAGGDSGPSLAALLASGSAEAGETVFAKCMACHTVEQGGAAGIGPNLYGVLGTPIGAHAPGFAYSSALAEKGGNWDYDAMNAWLASPRAFANGTKMSFAGLSSAEDRANVMLYLYEHGGGPAFPAAEEASPEGEEAIPAEAAEAVALEGEAEQPADISDAD